MTFTDTGSGVRQAVIVADQLIERADERRGQMAEEARQQLNARGQELQRAAQIQAEIDLMK